MSDLRCRIAGVASLVAAAGSTALHRAVYEGAKHGPTQLGELALGLLSFACASLGVLLILHGAGLWRGGPARPLGETGDRHGLSEGRHGVAAVLADRALAATVARRAKSFPGNSMRGQRVR